MPGLLSVFAIFRAFVGPISFFLLNFFLFFLGVTLLIMGVDILQLRGVKDLTSNSSAAEEFTKKVRVNMIPGAEMLSAAGMLIGAWLVATTSLGMAAAILGFRCLHMIYINLMTVGLLLWAAFILAASYIASKMKDIHAVAQFTFDFGLRFDYRGLPNETNSFEEMVNGMQVALGCCGLDSYTEYRRLAVNWVSNTGMQLVVPPSCCRVDTEAFWGNGTYVLHDINCTRHPSKENSFIHQPCYWLMETETQADMGMFYFLSTGVPAAMIVLIFLSVYLLIFGEGIMCG